jgi:NTP pyrophosphatase (non-canonical NTP hydrolase)
MKKSISEVAVEAHDNAVKHGFWDEEVIKRRTFGDSIALIHCELSEAYEEYRKGRAVNEAYYGEKGKPEGVPSELADCVIRIFDFCVANQIDIEKAILEKMAFNKTRPFRHNKKI